MSHIPPAAIEEEEDDYYATYFHQKETVVNEEDLSHISIESTSTEVVLDSGIDGVTEVYTEESKIIEVAPDISTIATAVTAPVANTVVQHAYEQISEDTKFVRLTTITTIVHSIIFLIYIGINGMRMLPSSDTDGDAMAALLGNILAFFESGNLPRGLIIGGGLILAIGYFILPPIGEAAMIFYLGAEQKRGSISLAKGFGKFFPMFEYNGMISFFTLLPYFIIVSRFLMLGLIDNILVVIILLLRGLVILFAYIFLPFTKFYIVQENLKPFDAMKKSMQLSLENIGTVIRYTFLQYALSIRFIINIVLFLGMPVLILYTASAFDITAPGVIGTIILVVTIGIGLLIAYVNGIIEAFFMTLRYRLFQQLK